MSQPTQVKGLGFSGEFIVIDNAAAPTFPTLNFTKESLGYDTITGGANSQGLNSFPNGTVPDAANPILNPNVPTTVQKTNGKSTGSVASLAVAFGSNNILGNTIVVVCGVGNGTAPTISDTQTNSYLRISQVANGTALNVAIFVATNCKAGANTVTVNNGGTTASIAAEIYEMNGLITVSNSAVADQNSSNTSGANTTSPAITINSYQTNDVCFVAYGLGTAAQTITVGASYNNDSGQLNPTTPAGLFSFASASLNLGTNFSSSPSATVGVAEPWAVAAATLKAFVPTSTATGLVVLNSSQSTRLYFKNPA